MSSKRVGIILGSMWCLLAAGCARPGPLVILKKQPPFAPWCAPNRRVQIGQRVVGHAHDGPVHRQFLVDETGREHDPQAIAALAWSYLEFAGEAQRIEEAFSKDACSSSLPVISINPVVVVLETYPDASWRKHKRDFAYESWYWRAQIQPNSDPHFRETMQWFSPELKQGPTRLVFSEGGVAEIVIPKGRLKLIREGNSCKTVRE